MRMVFSILLLLCRFSSYSQFEYFGSRTELKHQLEQAQQDTTKLRLYVHLSNNYVHSHPDTALQYAQRGLQLARKTNNQKWIALNSLSIAQSFLVLGNHPTAIEVTLKALPICEQLKDAIGIIFSNLIMSWAYKDIGDAKLGLPYAKRAKHVAEASKDSGSLQIALEHLVGEYEQLDALDSAISYGNQLLELQDRLKTSNWVGFYRTIARIYFREKQYDLALQYYRMTIAPSRKSGVNSDLLDAYIDIAQIYQQLGYTDSSMFYAYKTIREYPIRLWTA